MKADAARTVCHLTVLNPARHTRIFYKLARTQAAAGWKVYVIGQDPSPAPYEAEGVQVIPRRPFHRLAWERWLAPLLLFRQAWRVRARLYVIHAPELLFTAGLLKLTTRARILYDVHEDYQANIRAARHYPGWLRRPLAWAVRAWERLAVSWLDGVSYAEAVYENFLQLPPARHTLVRNTFQATEQPAPEDTSVPEAPYLLVTGTLAPGWGVLEALALWQKLCTHTPIRLVVAGHGQHPGFIRDIQETAARSGFEAYFTLIGGDTYVPYARIQSLIRGCRAGLALYEVSPNIQGKIPTRFYEYMALGKPLIFTPDADWVAFNHQWHIGLPAMPAETSASEWWEALDAVVRAYQQPPAEAWAWDTDGVRWLALCERVVDSVRSGSPGPGA
ncbi:MAG: glycosyltransferase [Bacteroidia bacterium]|nr:glycosyltransferase [Bacteroidia bacterium]